MDNISFGNPQDISSVDQSSKGDKDFDKLKDELLNEINTK